MTDPEVRQIRDSKVLAAMSHPLRRRLMDVLEVYGPSTASALAQRTGQAVGNISHHLKVLAASELVEEVAELARDRRERWWRKVSGGLSWSAKDFKDDPVADAAESLGLDREFHLARTYLATGELYGQEWEGAAFAVDTWARMTPDELVILNKEIIELLINKWAKREIPDDGKHREPVFLFTHGFPAKP
jgi:DNA-binding transcriptional ArsR family regulator